jgi:pimeloyl-ACP methyl ester carboxylesterase
MIQKLDSREEHFRIDGPAGRKLFLRYLPATAQRSSTRAVLYVHGATFPSALSVAYRFDGRSWRDALCDAEFDVWALDFIGFGESDRYPEMDEPADAHAPLCTAADAAEQLLAAVRFILHRCGIDKLSLVAHSWGSMPAGLLAANHPELVDRIVFFGPIARREPRRYETPPRMPAWRIITAEDQWNRFVEDVPSSEAPVLSRRHFDGWAKSYLASDAESHTRNPAGVKVPMGPFSEIIEAWHGQLAYDPGAIRAPVAIIRGEWDGLLPDADSRWLFDALVQSPVRRDVKISKATHLMHLEAMRLALWKESTAFLGAEDVAPVPV